MNWRQVNYRGKLGWTAEGQGSVYWLEPYVLPTPIPVSTAYYVIVNATIRTPILLSRVSDYGFGDEFYDNFERYRAETVSVLAAQDTPPVLSDGLRLYVGYGFTSQKNLCALIVGTFALN